MSNGYDLLIYSDGGSRGNPGPSAIGFVVCDGKGKVLTRHGKYIGIHTNNQSEYLALIEALEHALTYSRCRINCFLDSELVVKQLNGEYEVRDSDLQKLFLKVKMLEKKFESVKYSYVPRNTGKHSIADRLVNKALDYESKKNI
ncbi:MAG: ribonuclease HI family protein [Candidatus Freyarchaeota archaeon]|nr:ribonuclease HI family protein [Candidatus Jordarchaeia archaeon]MBS7267884.1 ribonuclease HI family protein [Candidatus Jordarchaeia archaeon]MBS7279047.1 ribonuclease HI family protein [Candidatus Jordarchaeia archaeon]